MSNLKDFKSIADNMMSGVAASDRLKADTLRRCVKRRKPARVILAPAAALAAVVLVSVIALSLPQPGQDNSPNIMMATETASALMTGQEGQATQQEAEVFFGEGFMMPEYTPEGFTLNSISLKSAGYKQVTLSFLSETGSYVVIEDKARETGGFEGFKSADINGAQGYVKSSDNADLPDTEAHWISKDAHYAVIGSITESEALSIARSMK